MGGIKAGVNFPVPLRAQCSSFLSIHLYVPFVQGLYKAKTSLGLCPEILPAGTMPAITFFIELSCHANAALRTRLSYKVSYKVVVQGCWHPYRTRLEFALVVQGFVQGWKVGAGCKRFSQAPIYIYIYI